MHSSLNSGLFSTVESLECANSFYSSYCREFPITGMPVVLFDPGQPAITSAIDC